MAETPQSLEALKAEAERYQEERREYFNTLTPPFTEEQQLRLDELQKLGLDALARYYEARDSRPEQG